MNNVDIVKNLYAAFGAHDRERILELLHPAVKWVQNEGFPGAATYADANGVVDGVFAGFRRDWQDWQANVTRWLDAGDAVIALGEYRGTFKATGRSMRSAFAHVYWVNSGKITAFEQYADTFKVAEAMALPPTVKAHD